jgi:hypothetical protein
MLLLLTDYVIRFFHLVSALGKRLLMLIYSAELPTEEVS